MSDETDEFPVKLARVSTHPNGETRPCTYGFKTEEDKESWLRNEEARRLLTTFGRKG